MISLPIIHMESPDVPWARDDDMRRVPGRFHRRIPAHTLSFLSYLAEKGIVGGKALVAGCPKSAIHLARLGFETHLIAQSLEGMGDIDLHGVHAYAQSLDGPLLFEDSFFDIVIDSDRILMERELARVMAGRARVLIKGPEPIASLKLERILGERGGFSVLVK